MPTWGEIGEELQLPENRQPDGRPNWDKVRRRYLLQLYQLTKRPVIVYATSFLEKDTPSNLVQITLGDQQGFMETVAGVQERQLDLIITSPGGLAEATESIVAYLRTKFDRIRAIVPVAAMSAATMLALGADEIVLGRHSQLGPIDPQITIATPEGPRTSPARAILDQFETAKLECQDPNNMAAWLPILRSYAPGLLSFCVDQQAVAERMVAQWLKSYMLRDDPDAESKADAAAKWFGSYENFRSHGRRVSLSDLHELGLVASELETDQALQDAVLSVHHALSHTFVQTGAVKIIENHAGRAWIKMTAQMLIQQPAPSSRPAGIIPMGPTPGRGPNIQPKKKKRK